jgi:POT family proton-dependent oligopeptide transporter
MVGKLYAVADPRRDSGFTIFYMGINSGALIAPVLTRSGRSSAPTACRRTVVFMSAGVGMLISLVWFYIGRARQRHRRPYRRTASLARIAYVVVGCLA